MECVGYGRVSRAHMQPCNLFRRSTSGTWPLTKPYDRRRPVGTRKIKYECRNQPIFASAEKYEITGATLRLLFLALVLFPRKRQQPLEPTLAQTNTRRTAQSGYSHVLDAFAAPSLHRSLGSSHSRAQPHRPNAIAENSTLWRRSQQ